MRVKGFVLKILLAVMITLTTIASTGAEIYINSFPEDITVTEGSKLDVPIFFLGGTLTGKQIELFLWREDAENSGKGSYYSASGWTAFTNYSEMIAVGPFTMVEYANLTWTALSSTTGLSSFYLTICMDGAVDGKLAQGASTSGASCSKTRKVNITKQTSTASLSLSLGATTLSTGTVNSAYSSQSVTMTASGGTSPYTYSCSGSGVSGLSAAVSPAASTSGAGACTISGTPTAAGICTVTFKVTDSAGATSQSSTQSFSVTAAPLSLSLGTTVLSSGTAGSAYSQAATMTASGGTSPYTYSCSGSGVSGLSASASSTSSTSGSGSCTISGTPAAAGTYTVTFKVTDSAGSTVQTSLGIIVSASSTGGLGDLFGGCTAATVSIGYMGISVAAAETKTTSVSVTNNCGTAVSYTATSNSSWISVPSSGSGTMAVTVNATGLSSGSQTGTITVSSTGLTSTTAIVYLTVTAPCTAASAAFSPTSVSQTAQTGANASSTSITVANNCGTSLAYTVNSITYTTGSGWITSPAASGSSSAGTGTLAIAFNSSSLAAGTYTASINITPTGYSAQNLSITLTVADAAAPTGGGSVTTLTSGSRPKFTLAANGYKLFTFSSSAAHISVTMEGQSNYEPNSDMLVMSGSSCVGTQPTTADIATIKATGCTYSSTSQCATKPNSSWYYAITGDSFEFVEIGTTSSSAPSGSYCVVVYNTGDTEANLAVGWQ